MDALVPDELPLGWTTANLGDLGIWTGGGTPSKSRDEFWTEGTVPWVSPKDMKAAYVGASAERITEAAVTQSAAKLVQAGSVLCVVRSGILQHTFPVAIADQDVTLNQDMRALTPFAGISAEYLRHYLRYRNDDVLHMCSKDGTTVASIEQPRLQEFPVPVAPEAEQTRIVAAVNALFEEAGVGEAALARAREGLTQFRASLLHAACTGALTADWRAANPANCSPEQLLATIAAERARKVAKRYRTAETPEGPPPFDIPRGWGWATVDQLCWQIDYGSSARCRPLTDGVPVLRMGNIQAGRLDYTDLKHLPRDHDEFPDLLLKPGDLLFNRTNSAELVGKTAVFDGHDSPVSFASYIVRAKVVHIHPRFLAHYINSPLGRQWIASAMTQQVGQANVSGGRLRTLCVPVPPLQEQDEIVARLADSLDVARDAALSGSCFGQAAKLRQSILHAGFTGRLVPQDRADEPAATLLARLRATPAATRRPRQRRAAAQPELIETPA
jgi:type I restriction enzyme S subunit